MSAHLDNPYNQLMISDELECRRKKRAFFLTAMLSFVLGVLMVITAVATLIEAAQGSGESMLFGLAFALFAISLVSVAFVRQGLRPDIIRLKRVSKTTNALVSELRWAGELAGHDSHVFGNKDTGLIYAQKLDSDGEKWRVTAFKSGESRDSTSNPDISLDVNVMEWRVENPKSPERTALPYSSALIELLNDITGVVRATRTYRTSVGGYRPILSSEEIDALNTRLAEQRADGTVGTV